MKLINKKEFIVISLDKNVEIFIIYIATFSITLAIQIYLFNQVLIELLLANKAFIEVLSKNLDYSNIFLFNFKMKLFKNTDINEYTIKLVKNI